MICKHKWRHYTQEVEIDIGIPGNPKTTVSFNVRICVECMVKQKQNPWNSNEIEWEEFDIYTKDEEREIQLRKIL